MNPIIMPEMRKSTALDAMNEFDAWGILSLADDAVRSYDGGDVTSIQNILNGLEWVALNDPRYRVKTALHIIVTMRGV